MRDPRSFTCIAIALVVGCATSVCAFGGVQQPARYRWSQLSATIGHGSRREWMSFVGFSALSSLTFIETAMAEDGQVSSSVEMKQFDDSLFSLKVPKDFCTLRRTQKGDLPDEKTGKGRRGSSIFTAGNMAKAEVIAVEVSRRADYCAATHCDEFSLLILSTPISAILLKHYWLITVSKQQEI